MLRKMRWAQVRRKTDSGETKDKVDHPDPAAAPLGTDEEAGGAETPAEDVARAADSQQPRDRRKPAEDGDRGES